jgi:hypothetical protein
MRLREYYKKLKSNEKEYFDAAHNAPCPMKNITKTKEIYFWKFIDQYLCFMSGPRALTLKADKSAELLGNMSLQGTVAKKNQGGKGAFPQMEISKILEHVGFKGAFDMRYAEGVAKFDGRKKPQFVIVSNSNIHKHSYMKEIPYEFMNDPDYSLTSASIIIANTLANASEQHRYHAVAGFICNGQGYIYDSNQRKVFKCNWWNKHELITVVTKEISQIYSFFRGGKVNYYGYAFALFTRNEFVKDVSPACLMKYRVKTPNVNKHTLADPLLGNKIDKGVYATMYNPAQIIAIKRKWARAEHRPVLNVPESVMNAIIRNANSYNSATKNIEALRNSGYTFNHSVFMSKLSKKFPNHTTTYTFEEAKAHLNKFKEKTARKYQYSLVWKGIPMHQRKILMHYRNTGTWTTKTPSPVPKPKTPSPSPKPKTPSPSPKTKRNTKVKANFIAYWLASQPENRQMMRNYISTYKSPSPPKPKPKSPSPNRGGPSNQQLRNARAHVNTLTTAVARKAYLRQRAINLSMNNWKNIRGYIAQKNWENQQRRLAKRSAKGKGKALV